MNVIPRDREREAVLEWIAQLRSVYSREIPLAELSKRREQVADLPELLWYSFGTVSALLYEISDTYGIIARHKDLTTSQSSRVCSALALLQCIASHPATKEQFLAAQIPQFLYPILQEKGTKATSIEYLKLTTLGVIGAMVKMDDSKAIQYLLDTEMIPICLHIMEDGTELPRTVATFVLQRILIDNNGLDYVCLTYERFSHVARILGKMILSMSLEETPPQRLLKHAIRCYGRLSDNSRAREALRQCLPDQLRDNTFDKYLKDDPQTKAWLIQLHNNLRTPTTIPYVSPFMGQS